MACLIVFNKGKIKLGIVFPFYCLILIFLFGSISGLENVSTRNFIRDIFYFINPIIVILVGFNCINEEDRYNKLLNSVVAISTITSLCIFATIIITLVNRVELESLRVYFDRTMWGNVFSIGILLFRDSKNITKKITLFILIIPVIFGLSRTLWIEFIVMIVIVILSKRLVLTYFLKSIKYIFVVSVAIFFFIRIFDFNYSSILKKINNSFDEINYSNDLWNSTDIQNNWRGYEIKQAREQFIDNSITDKIFGEGFGSGIFVGNYASLVHQNGNYIYVIHNGYYNILIKSGILGLILYLLFYISLSIISIKIYKKTKDRTDLIIVGISICLFIYTYLVKGIFSDYQQLNALLIIGGWLRYRRMSEKSKENINETKINRN